MTINYLKSVIVTQSTQYVSLNPWWHPQTCISPFDGFLGYISALMDSDTEICFLLLIAWANRWTKKQFLGKLKRRMTLLLCSECVQRRDVFNQ